MEKKKEKKPWTKQYEYQFDEMGRSIEERERIRKMSKSEIRKIKKIEKKHGHKHAVEHVKHMRFNARKEYSTYQFSKGKPKEYYLSDYYEDPMQVPIEYPVEKYYRIWNKKTKEFMITLQTRTVWRTERGVKAVVCKWNKRDNVEPDDSVYEIVQVMMLPCNPIDKPNRKEPVKPDKSNPEMGGWIKAGKQRHIIKKERIAKEKAKKRREEKKRIKKQLVLDQLRLQLAEQQLRDAGDILVHDNDTDLYHSADDVMQEFIQNENDIRNGTRKTVMKRKYQCICGVEHSFSPYVYGHWYETVKHACTVCNRVNHIKEGELV